MNLRISNKADFDRDNQLRWERLEIGNQVLLFISKDQNSQERAKKLNHKWIGPYRIYEALEDSTFYCIKDLDGMGLAESIAGNRLKKFFLRKDLLGDRILQERILKEMD